MQKLAVIATVLVAIILVILGNSYYQEKLQDIAVSAQDQYNVMMEEQRQREAEALLQKKEDEAKRLKEQTAGVAIEVRDLIISRFMDDKEIHMVAMGSRALIDSQNEALTPWPELLEEILNTGYEKKNFFEVTTKSYGYLTSLQVLNEERHLEVVELQPDIIIIEPFIWNDNGEVAVHDTIRSFEIMTSVFQKQIEDVIIFVQPAQPVHGSIYYPQYVEQLKESVHEMGFTYLDHWQDWPDVGDEELLLYTNSEHRMPNQAGHQLWSDSVAKHFLNR